MNETGLKAVKSMISIIRSLTLTFFIMKLLVLGASGGCGRQVVKKAIERGHEIVSVVRHETDYIPHKNENLIRGSVLNEGTIQKAIKGVDAVISCLGLKRKSKLNPWSEITSPTNLTTTVAKHLAHNLDEGTRVVVISAGGVGDSFDRTNWLIRFLINTSSLGPAYEDLENMESVLEKSDLDWLAVRPVTLTDGGNSESTHITDEYEATSMISRASVATWMLDALERDGVFVDHTEMIED